MNNLIIIILPIVISIATGGTLIVVLTYFSSQMKKDFKIKFEERIDQMSSMFDEKINSMLSLLDIKIKAVEDKYEKRINDMISQFNTLALSVNNGLISLKNDVNEIRIQVQVIPSLEKSEKALNDWILRIENGFNRHEDENSRSVTRIHDRIDKIISENKKE
jgi:hypothetical protein